VLDDQLLRFWFRFVFPRFEEDVVHGFAIGILRNGASGIGEEFSARQRWMSAG
jgi:hypothetical protein